MAKRGEVNQKPSSAWNSRLEQAERAKQRFVEEGRLSMEFFHGKQTLASVAKRTGILSTGSTFAPPQWQHRTNKMYELVRIYGAAMVHRNPHRLVKAHAVTKADVFDQVFGLSRDQMFSRLMQDYLNYTPHELGLKQHSRKAVDEAYMKGAGLLITRFDESSNLIGSFWESIDNLRLDPSVDSRNAISWGSIRRREPFDALRERYGDKAMEKVKPMTPNRDKPNEDMVEYWEIYSRRGIADKLEPDEFTREKESFNTQEAVFILMDTQGRIFHIGDWPIPFFSDNRWPWEVLVFNDVPNQLWPDSMLRPALSEMLFKDFAMSFAMDRLAFAKTIVATSEHADEQVRKALLSSEPWAHVTIPFQDGQQLNNHLDITTIDPQLNELLAWMSKFEEDFDKRTGLTELIFGFTSSQLRSAQEASIKDRNSRLRIDDMADMVEDWQTQIARKEALAARILVQPEDIDAIPAIGHDFREQMLQFGLTPGRVWGFYQQGDLRRIAREFDYRIEAGSIRKPNKDTELDKAAQLFRDVGPILLPLAQLGVQNGSADMIRPFNEVLRQYIESNDYDDPERFLIPVPAPQPQAPGLPGAEAVPGGPAATEGAQPGSEAVPQPLPPEALPPLPAAPPIPEELGIPG